MKISGFTCIRNNFILDYCVKETIESMLPICEEVVVSEGESTDGTREWLDDWARHESKLRIITYTWPNPKDDPRYCNKWLDHAQANLRYPMKLEADADEIIDPKSYPAILKAAEYGASRWFKRINFWRDSQHYAPAGHLVGSHVVRLCPTNVWMCSDEGHPEGEPECRVRAGWPPEAYSDNSLRILHYGFLRRNYIKKARAVLEIAAGSMDQRLEESERNGTPWQDWWTFEEPQGEDRHIVRAPVLEFKEIHPDLIQPWLLQRGYQVSW
jgi:hypothetical protein